MLANVSIAQSIMLSAPFCSYIYLDNSKINTSSPLYLDSRNKPQPNSYQDKHPKAMKKLSPSESHKNQVTSSTHKHLSKAAIQHPPPSFSLPRIQSKAPPTATTSAKEESHLCRAARWRAEDSGCLLVLPVISFLLPLHLRAPCSAVTPGLRQIDVRSPLYTEQRI